MSSRRTRRIVAVITAVFVIGVGSFVYADPDPLSTLAEAVPDNPPSNTDETTDRDGGESEQVADANRLELTFVDAGQADAILLQKGDTDILVDAGRSFSDELEAAMDTISSSLDYLIISHPHLDHYGGAGDIVEEYDVDRVITNGERRGPPRDDEGSGVRWLEFEDQIEEAGLELDAWSQGDEIEITDALTFDVLASGGDFENTPAGTDINDDSLVIMAQFAERRLLLSGDIEVAGGQLLVEEHCNGSADNCPALQADILKVPHHGSAHFHPEFFEAVDAEWAVFTADYDNTYGSHCLPRKETVRALADTGAQLKSTNQDGGTDIVATINPDGTIPWDVEDPEVFAWEADGRDCDARLCELDGDGDDVDCRDY